MNTLKDNFKDRKILFIGIFFAIIGFITAVLLFALIINPPKNYFIGSVKLEAQSRKLDDNLDRIIINASKLIYYEVDKPYGYRKNIKIYSDKIKSLIITVDKSYYELNIFLNKNPAHSSSAIKKSFNKSYHEWNYTDKPVIEKIIKYPDFISSKKDFSYFSKHILIPLLYLSPEFFIKTSSLHLIKMVNNGIYVFYIGTGIILLITLLFAVFINKFYVEIKKSELRFKAMFNNQPAILFLLEIESGKIVDANKAAANFYGYSRQELLSMNIKDINIFTTPEEAKKYRERSAMEGSGFAIFKHKLKNGDIKTIESRAMPVQIGNNTYLFSAIHDITAKLEYENNLLRLQKDLETEKALFKTITENADTGIVLNKEKFIYINPYMEKMTGYKADELYNIKVEDLFILSEKEKKLLTDNIQKRLRGEIFSYNYRLRYKTKSGNEPRWANCFVTTVFHNGEWVALGIISDITEIKLKEESLIDEMEAYKNISETDKLTGIYNRRAFDNKFTEYFNTSVRYNRPLSLIMFDIDDFKNINDSLGHSVGDTVLQELSSIVQDCLRTTDILARYGGEEFMIIVPETVLDKTVEFAERLRLSIESFNFSAGKNITCSFGVTSRIQNDTLEKMIYRVDIGLYGAKKSGKNSVKSIVDTIYPE